MNYGQAKDRARRFLNNRLDIDLDDLQPLVLDDINTGLEVQEIEGVTQLTPAAETIANVWSAELPPDFGRVKIVKANGVNLSPVDIQTLLDHSGSFTSEYAISGMRMWVQTAAPLVLVYTKLVTELTGDSDTNAILTRYPNIYIYGLAKHGNAQIQDFDAATNYQNLFLDAVSLANANNVMAIFSAGLAPSSPYAA